MFTYNKRSLFVILIAAAMPLLSFGTPVAAPSVHATPAVEMVTPIKPSGPQNPRDPLTPTTHAEIWDCHYHPMPACDGKPNPKIAVPVQEAQSTWGTILERLGITLPGARKL